MIIFQIAELGLWLDISQLGYSIFLPPSIKKFLKPVAEPQALFNSSHESQSTDQNNILILILRNEPLPKPESSDICKLSMQNWEYWENIDNGNKTFIVDKQKGLRALRVNYDFKSGEVLGDLSGPISKDIYPLQDLDIRLYAAWLANLGDVILHASGIILEGKGYAFIGDSGAGKSTLATALAKNPTITVLGEDQVILRYLDNQFRIYGTPWHLNSALYSPKGAPLEKLFFLGSKNFTGVNPISAMNGISQILQTAFIPFYLPGMIPNILDRLSLLSESVPFYELSYQLHSNILEFIID